MVCPRRIIPLTSASSSGFDKSRFSTVMHLYVSCCKLFGDLGAIRAAAQILRGDERELGQMAGKSGEVYCGDVNGWFLPRSPAALARPSALSF
jgi:hypothetical protein